MEDFEVEDLPSPTLEQLQALSSIRARDFVKNLESHPTEAGEYEISWQELNLESLEDESHAVLIGPQGNVVKTF